MFGVVTAAVTLIAATFIVSADERQEAGTEVAEIRYVGK